LIGGHRRTILRHWHSTTETANYGAASGYSPSSRNGHFSPICPAIRRARRPKSPVRPSYRLADARRTRPRIGELLEELQRRFDAARGRRIRHLDRAAPPTDRQRAPERERNQPRRFRQDLAGVCPNPILASRGLGRGEVPEPTRARRALPANSEVGSTRVRYATAHMRRRSPRHIGRNASRRAHILQSALRRDRRRVGLTAP
jgi:hypothetical protein